jgi:hypothetical protein
MVSRKKSGPIKTKKSSPKRTTKKSQKTEEYYISRQIRIVLE